VRLALPNCSAALTSYRPTSRKHLAFSSSRSYKCFCWDVYRFLAGRKVCLFWSCKQSKDCVLVNRTTRISTSRWDGSWPCWSGQQGTLNCCIVSDNFLLGYLATSDMLILRKVCRRVEGSRKYRGFCDYWQYLLFDLRSRWFFFQRRCSSSFLSFHSRTFWFGFQLRLRCRTLLPWLSMLNATFESELYPHFLHVCTLLSLNWLYCYRQT